MNTMIIVILYFLAVLILSALSTYLIYKHLPCWQYVLFINFTLLCLKINTTFFEG